ncbi:MAG: hypothetical protein WAM60_05990 [Candidatus Promineifilaceae bacterium]
MFKKLLPGQMAAFEDQDSIRYILHVYSDGGATVINQALLIIGDPAGPHVQISEEGIKLMNGETVLGFWQTDGDIFIGQDVDQADQTYFAIFATAQSYNGESVGAGDLLVGDNSSDQANLYWDRSAGQILLRGGTTTAAYIDSDGSLAAGAGEVILDETGLTIHLPPTIERDDKYALKFKIGSAVAISLTGRGNAGTGAVSEAELNANYTSSIANATALTNLFAGDVDGLDYSGLRVTAKKSNSAAHLVETIINDSAVLTVDEGKITAEKNLISEEHLTLREQSATPPAPAQDADAHLYIRNGKLVVQYDDGGTVRYKYLDLTGTGVTWTHTTTAP